MPNLNPAVDPMSIIITGASAGIGRLTALHLARPGNQLVLAARNPERLASLATEITARGAEPLSIPTDVSDPNALERLVAEALGRFGRIDVLVNNAGIECFSQFDELPVEQILQTIETNLTGAILLTRHVVPIMRRQRFGRIINMASIAGKHGPAYGAVYGATKAGLIAFTQALRGELMSDGILATAICPGFATSGGIYDEIVKATGRRTPFLLGGTSAEKVARAVEKAIIKAPPEMLLNFPWLGPVFLFRDAFPRLGEMVFLAVTRRFLRRAATQGKRTQK